MLKARIEKGNLYELRVTGRTCEIGAEVLTLIAVIYDNLDKDVKNEFKTNMTELLPVCFMSNEEKINFMKEGLNEDDFDIDDVLGQIDELKKTLEDLRNNENISNKA